MGDNCRGCYGGRPILCDGINREVHEFELKWVKGESNITIGIDEGRTNTEKDLWNGYSSYHYLLDNFGELNTKERRYYGTASNTTYKVGDTVSMKVDCGKQRLFYSVNKGGWDDHGQIATSKTPYYLLVTMWEDGAI